MDAYLFVVKANNHTMCWFVKRSFQSYLALQIYSTLTLHDQKAIVVVFMYSCASKGSTKQSHNFINQQVVTEFCYS
jgi:hypothetical protein